MTKTQSFAQRELEVFLKSVKDEDRWMYDEFMTPILSICEAFGNSGQSGGSAPFTASWLSNTVKKLCLQEPISPITGEDWEWCLAGDGVLQNARCSALFKEGSKSHYLYAIVWKGEDKYDTFSGTIGGITSRQFVKSFPFNPKTFYINCYRELYDKEKHGENTTDVVSCGDGDYKYFIKDKNQLDEVFAYYDKYEKFKTK